MVLTLLLSLPVAMFMLVACVGVGTRPTAFTATALSGHSAIISGDASDGAHGGDAHAVVGRRLAATADIGGQRVATVGVAIGADGAAGRVACPGVGMVGNFTIVDARWLPYAAVSTSGLLEFGSKMVTRVV
jgi:hypothetical protein